MIKVSDGFHPSQWSFDIEVINEPPTFASALADITVNTGDVKTYTLPGFVDPENQPVTATASYQGGSIPGFMDFSGT